MELEESLAETNKSRRLGDLLKATTGKCGILRCIGLCFHYHHLYLLSRLDQPLIQRIPAGLSSTVACLDITKSNDF